MPKKKKEAGLNMRRKNFKPIESHIKNCEDGVQIMLKGANVEENNIQNPPSEEKTIENFFHVQEKLYRGQLKRIMVSSRDKETRSPIHMNIYMVNCILINGNPLI